MNRRSIRTVRSESHDDLPCGCDPETETKCMAHGGARFCAHDDCARYVEAGDFLCFLHAMWRDRGQVLELAVSTASFFVLLGAVLAW